MYMIYIRCKVYWIFVSLLQSAKVTDICEVINRLLYFCKCKISPPQCNIFSIEAATTLVDLYSCLLLSNTANNRSVRGKTF